MLDHALTIRAATSRDDDVLSRLAGLDSRPRLRGQTLLAERDEVAVAAVALTSGHVVADPFHHTQEAVHLLRLRRYQLLRQSRDVGPARLLLRRLAPSPRVHLVPRMRASGS